MSMNEYLLNEMKSLNPDLDSLSYDSSTNTLSFNGHTLDLSYFSISEIYNSYSQLKNDIEVMKPEDLYNAIAINVAVSQKEDKKEVNNEESIEQIQKINPTIQNISLIKKENELGTERQYVHIVTSDGANHILYDQNPSDVLVAFKNIAMRNSNNYENITENDLYDELKRTMDDLDLVDSKDAQSRDDLSTDFKNKMTSMESYVNEYANNDGTRVLGNDEHDIYIQNSGIVTFNTDDNGNIIREDHEGATIDNNENITNDGYQSNNELQDNIIEIDVSNLIDVSEYIDIIESPNELNEEEQTKINFFEGFMGDLYAYKDYLGTEAYSMWQEYEQYIIVMNSLGADTNKKENAVNSYYQIQENTKSIELKNAKNKALILEYQADLARKQAMRDGMAGTASALLIIEITTFVSITLGTIIYLILK